jgi:hypothetical protein
MLVINPIPLLLSGQSLSLASGGGRRKEYVTESIAYSYWRHCKLSPDHCLEACLVGEPLSNHHIVFLPSKACCFVAVACGTPFMWCTPLDWSELPYMSLS